MVGAPDQVPLDDKPNAPETFCGQGQCKPHPYTYSDFTGFGLVNFTNPKGYYSLIQKGCGNGQLTRWYAVKWDSDQPVGTEISVVARSAATIADLKTAVFTGSDTASPAALAQQAAKAARAPTRPLPPSSRSPPARWLPTRPTTSRSSSSSRRRTTSPPSSRASPSPSRARTKIRIEGATPCTEPSFSTRRHRGHEGSRRFFFSLLRGASFFLKRTGGSARLEGSGQQSRCDQGAQPCFVPSSQPPLSRLSS